MLRHGACLFFYFSNPILHGAECTIQKLMATTVASRWKTAPEHSHLLEHSLMPFPVNLVLRVSCCSDVCQIDELDLPGSFASISSSHLTETECKNSVSLLHVTRNGTGMTRSGCLLEEEPRAGEAIVARKLTAHPQGALTPQLLPRGPAPLGLLQMLACV